MSQETPTDTETSIPDDVEVIWGSGGPVMSIFYSFFNDFRPKMDKIETHL